MAIKHDGAWFLTIDEAAEMEQITRRETYQRVKEYRLLSADRRQLDGKRGTLVPVKALSHDAKGRWQKRSLSELQATPFGASGPGRPGQAQGPAPTLDPHDAPPLAASAAEPQQLTLTPPSELDRKIAALTLSAPEKAVAVGRFRAIQPLVNHDYGALGFTTKTAYVRDISKLARVSQKTIWDWYARYRENQDIGALANERRGPQALGAGSQALDMSQRAYVKLCWEVEKLNKVQTYRKLIGYLEDKQRGCGISHAYEFPSSTTVSRFIDELDALVQARRENADAVKAACGYIDRTYTDLESLGRVDTDEWKCDALAYDDRRPRDVRRFWLLIFYDVRSMYPLAWELVAGSEHEVRHGIAQEDEINLLVRLVREVGVPGALNSDRGRFRGQLFGGRPLGEQIDKVFAEANGILDQLRIGHNTPREKNPRGNREERFHRYLADCCRTIPGWIGSNTRERKMAPGDEQHAQHKELASRGFAGTPLLSRSQLLAKINEWMEAWRDHESRGTDMQGMSPRAVFHRNTPPAGFRRVSDEELAWVTARHFYDETIEPGGIVTLPDGKRYSHPLLTLIAGECRECVRLRHDDSFISVLPARKGEDAVIATRRVPVGANDPTGLARATEAQAKLRKLAAEMGVAKQWTVDSGQGTGEQAPGPNGTNEISSSEIMIERIGKRARPQAPPPEVESIGGANTKSPAPSFYDFAELGDVEKL